MGHGQKSGHGRKNVAHGKNGKMLINVYFFNRNVHGLDGQ